MDAVVAPRRDVCGGRWLSRAALLRFLHADRRRAGNQRMMHGMRAAERGRYVVVVGLGLGHVINQVRRSAEASLPSRAGSYPTYTLGKPSLTNLMRMATRLLAQVTDRLGRRTPFELVCTMSHRAVQSRSLGQHCLESRMRGIWCTVVALPCCAPSRVSLRARIGSSSLRDRISPSC